MALATLACATALPCNQRAKTAVHEARYNQLQQLGDHSARELKAACIEIHWLFHYPEV